MKETYVYIGKSRNIKKRVNQHFTGVTNKAKNTTAEVSLYLKNWKLELVALLKESEK
jgi:DNA polymerase-3 subunit epsilon